MAKTMLIDASHREEVRMAITDGQRIEEFETEIFSKRQLKGNIYLAKVIRVEPSLQAAFVEFGGNRQGFLPFSEIHPDYYHIPRGDRHEAEDLAEEEFKSPSDAVDGDVEIADASGEEVEGDPELSSENSEEDFDEDSPRQRPLRYRYKIQEVIKRRQILLIQVVKEERGGKGAAVTTYLSLPGRYCVLMPNSGVRRGGISRKITEQKDRNRLRKILDSLDIPEGVSLIVRTAGADKKKTELKKDFEYLLRLWADIREKTLSSIAPALIYAEGDLIKRALRDAYTKDIEDVFIEGDEAYKAAKNLMKTMSPAQSKKVQQYKDKTVSLFQKYHVEDFIDQMFQPTVALPSGGSIVIAQTEALVAIDVNSGKSTRERHIHDTALKTNLEAAKEVARQIRLRDLGGLVVIDFIDMSEKNHIAQVEKIFQESLKQDRARIKMGKIGQFGLLELSRQRLRPSLLESSTHQCPHCRGSGFIRSAASMALFVLRQIEGTAMHHKGARLNVRVPVGVDTYILNEKRRDLVDIETTYDVAITVKSDGAMQNAEYHIEVYKEDQLVTEIKSESAMPSKKLEPKAHSYEKSKDRPQHTRASNLQKKTTPAPTIEEKKEAHSLENEGEGKDESLQLTSPKKKNNRKRSRSHKKSISETPAPIADEMPHVSQTTETSSPEVVSKETTAESVVGDGRKNKKRRRHFDRRRHKKNAEGRDAQSSTGERAGAPVATLSDTKNAATTPANTQAREQEGDSGKERKGWWKRLIES